MQPVMNCGHTRRQTNNRHTERKLLSRFSCEEASDDVAFPHPEASEDHDGEEDEAGGACVAREFVEWAVDVPDDGNADDDVNPAGDGALRGLVHVSSTPRGPAPSCR